MSGYGPENTPLSRIDFKAIRTAIFKLINLEKGIGYTLVNLAIRPGETINSYLFENRTKLVKPIGFLFFTATIATFLTVNFIDLKEVFYGQVESFNSNAVDPDYNAFMEEVSTKFGQFYNLLSLLAVPVLAFGSYMVYNRNRYYYAEHLVISAYLTGFITAGYIVFFPFFITAYMPATTVYLITFVAYCTFAFIQIFKETLIKGVFKGIVTQIIYFALFIVLSIVLTLILAIYVAFKMKGKM